MPIYSSDQLRDVDIVLGFMLKACRERRRFSLEQTADALGLSPQTLLAHEKGELAISASLLYSASNLFDLPMQSLIMPIADPEAIIDLVDHVEVREALARLISSKAK